MRADSGVFTVPTAHCPPRLRFVVLTWVISALTSRVSARLGRLVDLFCSSLLLPSLLLSLLLRLLAPFLFLTVCIPRKVVSDCMTR
jgi:hypothetical protein